MNPTLAKWLAPYASLRLTVTLLAMATFLVFAGTVAQVDKGIWTVVDEYFRCAFAWIELRIFFPRAWGVPGGFWFPGGWLIAGLLLLNVVSAHLIRFKMKATGGMLIVGWAVIGLGAVLMGLIVAGVFETKIAATEDDAFWRVLARLGKGGGVAIVLAIGCQLVFRRRAGIVLLHGGIILLIISEFFTGLFASEGRMRIEAGTSANYIEHTRTVELALIDRTPADVDRVSVVPMRDLLRGGVISDPALPVDVEVLRFMRNSQLVDARQSGGAIANPADRGAGLIAIALDQPEVSGTQMDRNVDLPATYVRLRHKGTGESLGTYLASPWLDGAPIGRQSVVVDGTPYDLTLRFARTYKPYRVELLEFRHDVYVGTDTPKNFSSLVRVIDDEQGVDRTVKIWMNNPLRYAGDTFYQSSFEPGRDVTILQVVRNGSWMVPYLSCMIVGVGMTMHMGGMLLDSLRRRMVR